MDQEIEIQSPRHKLVKQEIIDAKYDKDLFFDYCSTRKTYGDNLSNWSINELQGVINDFVSYQKEKQSLEQEKQQKLLEERLKAENIQRDIEKIKMNRVEDQNGKPYSRDIICRKLEKTVLNDRHITCSIKNPKSIETGFFSSNYIIYEVVTEELQWIVRRRYSDFEWLRLTIVKLFPRLFIPPLPNKKIGSRRFEVDFVEKRMSFLQKFLDSLLENETFKACEALTCFLSMSDRSQFEYKMKELTSYTPSPSVEEIKTLSGQISIIDDENNEKYYVNIYNYFRLQFQLLERLNYNMKNFYFNMATACITLESVQKDFETLHLLNSRVLMKEEITKSYEELGIFFKNWKRILFNQNEIIKVRMKNFFKYIKMEGSAYEELIQSREDLRGRFVTENSRLVAKKEKLWAGMDPNKWEIMENFEHIDRLMLQRDRSYAFAKMCTRETQVVENLHHQLGYANRNNIDELKKMINRNSMKYIVNMKAFTEEFYPTLNDSLNVWTQLATYAEIVQK